MRLIDADALSERLKDLDEWCRDLRKPGIEQARCIVHEEPTIDAVPVVRCKECKYWEDTGAPADAEDGEHYCLEFARTSMPDDFCSRGERECDNDTP